mmetsp:Transcript_19017/g.42365  ORF Transcript_19017/g.42365 Transcript_19017/m.42365 type:complete len:271 (-) Transcript_19017:440-1252(-)
MTSTGRLRCCRTPSSCSAPCTARGTRLRSQPPHPSTLPAPPALCPHRPWPRATPATALTAVVGRRPHRRAHLPLRRSGGAASTGQPTRPPSSRPPQAPTATVACPPPPTSAPHPLFLTPAPRSPYPTKLPLRACGRGPPACHCRRAQSSAGARDSGLLPPPANAWTTSSADRDRSALNSARQGSGPVGAAPAPAPGSPPPPRASSAAQHPCPCPRLPRGRGRRLRAGAGSLPAGGSVGAPTALWQGEALRTSLDPQLCASTPPTLLPSAC